MDVFTESRVPNKHHILILRYSCKVKSYIHLLLVGDDLSEKHALFGQVSSLLKRANELLCFSVVCVNGRDFDLGLARSLIMAEVTLETPSFPSTSSL